MKKFTHTSLFLCIAKAIGMSRCSSWELLGTVTTTHAWFVFPGHTSITEWIKRWAVIVMISLTWQCFLAVHLVERLWPNWGIIWIFWTYKTIGLEIWQYAGTCVETNIYYNCLFPSLHLPKIKALLEFLDVS